MKFYCVTSSARKSFGVNVSAGYATPTWDSNSLDSGQVSEVAKVATNGPLVLRFEKTKTDLVIALEGEPAVEDVTVAATIPGAEPRARIAIDGAVNSQSDAVEVRFNRVATDFFDAFGARVIAGRALRDSDTPSVRIVVARLRS